VTREIAKKNIARRKKLLLFMVFPFMSNNKKQ